MPHPPLPGTFSPGLTSPPSSRRSWSALLFLAALTAFAACDGVGADPVGAVSEVSIEFIDGALVVGATVPVEAFVTDTDGLPVTGATVRWSVSEGTVAPQTATTNDEGSAFAEWTLGTRASSDGDPDGGQRITATVEGSDGVETTVEVNAAIGPVGDIEVALDADTLEVNTTEALRVVSIEDVYGNEVPEDEFDEYGVSFTSLDTTVVEIVDAPTGEEGVVVGVSGASLGTARVVATAAAEPPPAVPEGSPRARRRAAHPYVLPRGAAADTVTVTVVPFLSGGPFPAVAVSTGYEFTCGLDAAGSVYCWGLNMSGQLGTGDFTSRLVPARVGGLPGPATAVSAGFTHACALLADGRVFCWGERTLGRLGQGDGSQGFEPTPVQALLPAGLPPAVEITATSVANTCARLEDGALYCWGYDGEGALGDGAPPQPNETLPLLFSDVPVRVNAPGVSFASVRAGEFHVCATATNGDAYCWGNAGAGDGRLGVGFTFDQSAPQPRLVAAPGVAFSAVAPHAAATSGLDTAGRLYGWGEGENPDPSGSAVPEQRNEPAAVATSETFSQIAGGLGVHGCALTGAGAAYCWGENLRGQLGLGDTSDVFTPAPVVSPDPGDPLRFTRIAVSTNHSCAVRDGAQEAYCWGDNDEGQLGTGGESAEPVTIPTRVETDDGGRRAASSYVTDARAHRRAWCRALDPDYRRFASACRSPL